MIRSTTTILLLCTALAACSKGKPLETVRGEPSCPDYISGADAIGIAKEYARQRDIDIAEHVIEAIWRDAEWSVFASVPYGRYATVYISPDGRVTRCSGHHACSTPKDNAAARCERAVGTFISGATAVRIASDYLSRRNIPHDIRRELAGWWAAHWDVWFNPPMPAAVDSDFSIVVSPDGLETELIAAMGMPSPDSLLYRGPGPN